MLLLWLIAFLYALLTVVLWWAWTYRLGSSQPPHTAPTTWLTVLIPVRNEAAHIVQLLQNLNAQTYRHFDVIVADDASTDETRELVEAFRKTADFPLTLLALPDEPTASPKKRAISQAVAQARGGLIVTTDGDCRVGPDWLAVLAQTYAQTGANMLTGPVTFADDGALFTNLQIVEFASLIGAGAATLTMGFPTMCNGANLCYEKKAFEAVGGFAGVDQLASGDDELLMHKIAARYPGGVQFVKNRAAIVTTYAHRTWPDFYRQRRRWASKWRAYQSVGPSVLAVFIFVSNCVPLAAAAAWLLGFIEGYTCLALVALKWIPEFVFLRQVLIFLQKKPQLAAIPLTQLLYPVYVVVFGLTAQGKGYRWKGRRLH